MITRYHLTAGASTRAGGKVMSGGASKSINGARIACVGDPVSCPQCHATGVIELVTRPAEPMAYRSC